MDRRTTETPERAAAGRGTALLGAFALLCLAQTGCYCLTKTDYAIPATRVQPLALREPRENLVPVDYALLGQEKPPAHVVGSGDLLGVYVYGVMPPETDQTPVVQRYESPGLSYYPPTGQGQGPSLGLPIQVDENGKLVLPLVGALDVAGKTLAQVTELVRLAYRDTEITRKEGERVVITLIKPRVTRVVVLRGDTKSEVPQFRDARSIEFSHSGYAETVDLPPGENDVLHALAATGGLPGTDALNEVWVLRDDQPGSTALRAQLQAAKDPAALMEDPDFCKCFHRIPLMVTAGCPVPFTQTDVLLTPGDVVVVPPRNEYYYTGGLLTGAKVPLPRDEDIDILQAIALAGGSVGGPSAANGATGFRSGGGPGNIIPPSRVLVIRKLPDGRQIPIRIDLGKALRDEKERLIIQPNDVVLVQYKAYELAGNVLLNFFNVSIVPGR